MNAFNNNKQKKFACLLASIIKEFSHLRNVPEGTVMQSRCLEGHF